MNIIILHQNDNELDRIKKYLNNINNNLFKNIIYFKSYIF